MTQPTTVATIGRGETRLMESEWLQDQIRLLLNKVGEAVKQPDWMAVRYRAPGLAPSGTPTKRGDSRLTSVTMRKLAPQVAIALLGLVVLGTLAWGGYPDKAAPGESGQLGRYAETMNFVLQRHMNVYSHLALNLSQVENHMRSAQSDGLAPGAAFEAITELRDELEQRQAELSALVRDWIALKPPDRAERFHEIVFDMMQKKLEGVRSMKSMANQLIAGAGYDEALARDADLQFDTADWLWAGVFAE